MFETKVMAQLEEQDEEEQGQKQRRKVYRDKVMKKLDRISSTHPDADERTSYVFYYIYNLYRFSCSKGAIET